MKDQAEIPPALVAVLQKASARFEDVKASPEWQSEWAKLRDYVRDEFARLKRCGALRDPSDDDDFGLDGWSWFAGRDPSTVTDFDDFCASIRGKLLELEHQQHFQRRSDETGPEWSAWIRKAEWRKAWDNMPAQSFRRLLKTHGQADPNNQQLARFPIQWLKDAGHSIPSSGG